MKKNLAIFLENLDLFSKPKLKLEQYPTPPSLAAEIAVTASIIDSDIDTFFDLGCGTGMLTVAMGKVGFETVGVDIDRESLKIAIKNVRKAEIYADFIHQDVRFLRVKRRVGVVMNPPFGIKRRHADRVFLEKAFEIGNVVYSIHSAGSENFVNRMANLNDFRVSHVWKYRIPLKKTYPFHQKPYKLIPVEVFRMERMLK